MTPNAALRRLHDVMASRSRVAPVHSVIDLRVTDAETGKVRTRMPAEVARRESGGTDLAPVLVLADAVLALTGATVLPPGKAISTLTLHVEVHGLDLGEAEAIQATGQVGHVGDQSATTVGELRTSAGGLLATISSRVLQRTGEALDLSAGVVVPATPADLRGWRDNLTVTELSPDRTALKAGAPAEWGNTAGRMQGGAVALVAERVLHELWTQHGLEDSPDYDLDLTLLTGVTCDGHQFTAEAGVVHRGRSLVVAEARVIDEGRTALVALASRYRKLPRP